MYTHEHDVLDNDRHFIINPNTREIINQSDKKTLVKSDHNSEIFTFEMPRYVEGHDMTLCNVNEVHYINLGAGNDKGKTSNGLYQIEDLQVDTENEEKVVFSWVIKGNATKYEGTLQFKIKFKCVNNNAEITYLWNTLINKELSVGEDINNTDYVEEMYADVLEQWKQDFISSGAYNGIHMFPYDGEVEIESEQSGLIYECFEGSKVGDYILLSDGTLWVINSLQDIQTAVSYHGVFAKGMSKEQEQQLEENTQAIEQLNKTNTNLTNEVNSLKEDIANLPSGGGTVVSSIEPMEDDIPRVFFDEAIPQTKTDTVTKFRYVSKTKDVSGYAEFKAQGNSSLSYPKKNMTVKMYQDEACENKLKVNFKDWGKQSKHVYKANWIDLTHARNIVSARLWGQLVKSRGEYESYPTEFKTSPNQGAIDGFPIKVYSQGIYQGRYSLNIPKDAWMTNMDDSLDNHCILCGENYVSGCFRATANINGNDWSDEVHKTVPTSIKTRWNEIISFVMNSSDEEFKANLSNYFYVESLIDYFIFGVVSCGLDAFGKNQLYDTYDGQKWIATMYDMDSTWGLWWNGQSFVSSTYSREEFQDFKDGQGNLLYIRLLANFIDDIKARATVVLNDVLSIPNIINEFEEFIAIASNDLVKEDYASTTANGKFTGIPQQGKNNIQQIRQYVIERHPYCVEYFNSLVGDSGSEEGGDEPEIPVEPDTPIEPTDPSNPTISLDNVGLWKETGLNSSSTAWKTSEIMELPTGFEYDTITVKDTTATTIVDVFDNEQNFVYEYAGTPATCILQDVQYYAVAKSNSSATELEIQFTQTYPNATKIPTPNNGLWKSTGLDTSATNWWTSEIHELPTDALSGTIKFADGKLDARIIDTFDSNKNFIKENANVSSITFDSNVRYYAVALNPNHYTHPSNVQKTNLALYVEIE